jgi:hypothetical protein
MYGLVFVWTTNMYNYLYILVVTVLLHAVLLLVRYLPWRQTLREITQDTYILTYLLHGAECFLRSQLVRS